jgi:PKD repeat protein
MTSFALSGVVPITVTVTDVDGNTNTAAGKIYVTEDRQPFSIIDIKSDSSVFSQKSICSGQEALTFDRANSVSLSADKSVNTDGRTDDMTYFWKIGLNKTSTQKNVSYTFDELGCEEIILTVSDKITGASHTSRVWVKVINLTPIFNDISVDVENLDIDPMKINLKVVGAKDPDGLIRSYTWYYYTDKDDQAQGFRITRTPEATFVLPKITGRYYFAVMMEDSNGAKVNTKEVSEVLFSTPELYVNTNLSTPIIENFKADNSEVKF